MQVDYLCDYLPFFLMANLDEQQRHCESMRESVLHI